MLGGRAPAAVRVSFPFRLGADSWGLDFGTERSRSSSGRRELARDTFKLPIPNSMNRHHYLKTTDSLDNLFRDMIDSLDRPFFLLICRWVALLMSSPRVHGSRQNRKENVEYQETIDPSKAEKGIGDGGN
jgi:hypothetical protein